jgi:hypothetical protein
MFWGSEEFWGPINAKICTHQMTRYPRGGAYEQGVVALESCSGKHVSRMKMDLEQGRVIEQIRFVYRKKLCKP